jgi:hypothetical protein
MRRACSVRRYAILVVFIALLAGCGAATSSTNDDASISTRVKIALLNDPQVDEYRLDAKTLQGVVTLSGTVKTQAEIDRAIAVARKTRGVKDVKSELKIQTPEARRQTPDARRQTPDARRQTPDARRQTPDARRQTPDARRQTPDTRHQTPDARQQTSDLSRRSRIGAKRRRRTPDADARLPCRAHPSPGRRFRTAGNRLVSETRLHCARAARCPLPGPQPVARPITRSRFPDSRFARWPLRVARSPDHPISRSPDHPITRSPDGPIPDPPPTKLTIST